MVGSLGVGRSVVVRVRVEPGARTPPDVEQEGFRPDRRRVLGEQQHGLRVVLGEGRSGRIEDQRRGLVAGPPGVAVQPGGGGIQPESPGPEHPGRVVGLLRPENDLPGGQPLAAPEVAAATGGDAAVRGRSAEGDVGLPDLTPMEPDPRLADQQLGQFTAVAVTGQTPGPQRDGRDRRSVELDLVGRAVAGGQVEAEPVQPVGLIAVVGDAGPAADHSGVGQLDGDVDAELRDRILRLDDHRVGTDLGHPTGQLGLTEQPGLATRHGPIRGLALAGAGQGRVGAPGLARFGDQTEQRLDRVPVPSRGRSDRRDRPGRRPSAAPPARRSWRAGAAGSPRRTAGVTAEECGCRDRPADPCPGSARPRQSFRLPQGHLFRHAKASPRQLTHAHVRRGSRPAASTGRREIVGGRHTRRPGVARSASCPPSAYAAARWSSTPRRCPTDSTRPSPAGSVRADGRSRCGWRPTRTTPAGR